jgi:ABC-type transport system substrate-binding protein
MKEPKWRTCTEKDLWEYVAWFLGKNGINTVLVGGSVVSIYSNGAYTSGDLDIVIESYQISHKQIEEILAKINFSKTGTKNYFKHPECDHILIEFMSPPVSIGEDYNIKPNSIEVDKVIIKILSPTDCIKDRLGSYIYFKARECLDQAVLVAKAQPYSKNSIKKWCENEGESARLAFNEFIKLIK